MFTRYRFQIPTLSSPFISYIPLGAWWRSEFRTRSVSAVTNIRVISTIKMNISRVRGGRGFVAHRFPSRNYPPPFVSLVNFANLLTRRIFQFDFSIRTRRLGKFHTVKLSYLCVSFMNLERNRGRAIPIATIITDCFVTFITTAADEFWFAGSSLKKLIASSVHCYKRRHSFYTYGNTWYYGSFYHHSLPFYLKVSRTVLKRGQTV